MLPEAGWQPFPGTFVRRTMLDLLKTSEAQVILWSLAGAALCVVGVYIVKRFRGRTGDDQPKASELLTNFREIHSQGGLSDEEFRTIKAQLRDRMQREVNDNEDRV
jgi:uncharacterized membrane protein